MVKLIDLVWNFFQPTTKKDLSEGSLKAYDFEVSRVTIPLGGIIIEFNDWNKFLLYINYKFDEIEFYKTPDGCVYVFNGELVVIYNE